MEFKEFLNIISICNVILDPFPFGGCNTSFEAFDLNIPVVTYPSNILGGNFTNGLYKKMGVSDCVVNDVKTYICKCLEIGTNQKYKNLLCRKIKANKYKIFQDKESISNWANLFVQLYESNKI